MPTRRFLAAIAGLSVVLSSLLLLGGGVLYSLGAATYATKWPNPWPGTFGFHEVFHTLTIAAFVTHYVGVSIATYSLR